jgi:uncharacterized CHY-type Zn-finger protein
MLPNSSHVRGVNLDPQTRCEHYNEPNDIIAIKMKCCGVYYACKDCHALLADHPVEVWPESEWNQKAILCGSCANHPPVHAQRIPVPGMRRVVQSWMPKPLSFLFSGLVSHGFNEKPVPTKKLVPTKN